MAIDALKIDKVNKNIDAINGFKHTVNGKEVYHPDNKPTAADLNVVNKAGDTMSGNLTAPKVLVSTAQGTEANSLTRKDYVDQKFAGVTSPTAILPMVIDANKAISIKPANKDTAGSMSAADKNKLDGMQGFAVNGKSTKLTGPINFDSIESSGFYNIYNGTAAGSVNAPIQYGTMIVVGSDKDTRTFVTQIATDRTNAATYIRTRNDGTMAWTAWTKQLDSNGGEFTGNITLNNNAPQIHFVEKDNADKRWTIASDGKTFRIHENDTQITEASTVLKANENGNTEIRKPVSYSAQVQTANALTRKDYVDAATLGFGLGSNKARSLSGKSCNDVDGIGFYGVYDGTTDTPYGNGPSGSMLIHQQWGTGDGGVSSQIFIGYPFDRMHFRRQYKGVWQPWVEVSTEKNSITKNSAGRVVEMIDIQVPDAMGLGKHSIRLNNGSIGGLNSISFNDPTEFNGEGIFFPKEGKSDASTDQADYDVVRAYNGVLYFNNKPTYGEWNKPNASDVGALKAEKSVMNNVNLNTLGSFDSDGVYYQTANASATVVNNYPVALAGTLICTRAAYGCQQEYTTFTGRKFQRGLTGAWNGNGPWGAWTEFYSEVSPSITAPLFKSSGDYGFVRSTDNSQGMFVGADKRTIIGGGADTGYVVIRPSGIGNVTGEVTIKTSGINAPDFIQTTVQTNLPGASTRKDYVDAQIATIDAKNVAKAGDTMTGILNFAQIKGAAAFVNKSSIRFADGVNTWFHLFSDGGAFKLSQGTAGQTNLLSMDSSGNMDIAGSTISKYFRTDELGGTDTVAPYASKSQGGAFAAMYNRHASFHTDVVQTGSSYAPNTSIKYSHNAGWAGMYSTGVWNLNAAIPGAYCIAHISSNAADAFTWSFDGKTGRFSTNGIDTGGNINIRNNAPTVLFQDTDHLSAFAHTNSNNFHILRSAAANGTTWDAGPNGVHPMTLNLSNGDATFSRNGSFNDVQIRSDIRLKSNLIDIKNALDKVCSLTGKTFDKFGCDKREAGIIAQDLQKVLPEAVGSFKNTEGEEYLTVSNSGVNALLVEAIKELRTELNELKSKLN